MLPVLLCVHWRNDECIMQHKTSFSDIGATGGAQAEGDTLMLTVLTRNWWLVVARGLLGLLFGLAAIVWPRITLTALVLLFGVFAVTHGVLALLALLYIIAAWAILTGSLCCSWRSICTRSSAIRGCWA